MKALKGTIRKGDVISKGHKYPIITEKNVTEGQEVKFKIIHKFDKVVDGRTKYILSAEII